MEGVETEQSGGLGLAQAPRIVKQDVLQQRELFADVEELVHLLFVFRNGKSHARELQRINQFGGDGVLVERRRNGPQALRRKHGGVEPGAIFANDGHVLAALQPERGQAAGQLVHPVQRPCPGCDLPDSQVLFSPGDGPRPQARLLLQQARKSRHLLLRAVLLRFGHVSS
ncbi:hypothetical protein GALL_430710 [mine drainage metagenome]|uniref:Uncharacterized protein n=1 Tax=mine drainage metagenome TaxID=410659 RepID=A0A1J5PWI9_9ZZZZ